MIEISGPFRVISAVYKRNDVGVCLSFSYTFHDRTFSQKYNFSFSQPSKFVKLDYHKFNYFFEEIIKEKAHYC